MPDFSAMDSADLVTYLNTKIGKVAAIKENQNGPVTALFALDTQHLPPSQPAQYSKFTKVWLLSAI